MTFFGLRRSTVVGVLLGCAAVSLGGCQLVSGLGQLETNQGGGGSSIGGATSGPSGPGSTSSSGGGAGTTTSSTSSTSTASSSSTGAGGAASELVPCGGVTDSFNTQLDPAVWTTSGQATFVNGRVRTTVQGLATSYFRLTAPSAYNECYATIRLVKAPNQAKTFFRLEQVNTPTTLEGLTFSPGMSVLTEGPQSGMSVAVVGAPDGYGVAFHGALVHFFYKGVLAAQWTLVATVARQPWMDGAPGTSIAMGAIGAAMGNIDNAQFDDFNVDPIHLTDLP